MINFALFCSLWTKSHKHDFYIHMCGFPGGSAPLHGAAKELEMTKALKKQQIHLYVGNSSWVMNEKMKRVKLRRGQATVIGTENVIKVGLKEGNTTGMQ